MGSQDHLEKKPLRHHGAAADEDKTGKRKNKKKEVAASPAAVWIALPPLRPIKVGRRRRGHGGAGAEEEEEAEEEVTTPTGEWCRIPAEAATCPPAPKKQRTAVATVGGSDRRCSNRDDAEPTEEYFRVPADLEAVFAVVGRVAEAN